MSDAFFFIGVLLFFFILWFASGGPTRPISFAGPYITPITDVNTVQEGYRVESTGSSGSSSSGNIKNDLIQAQDTLARLKRSSSELKAFGEASPYRGIITVGYGGVSATDPDQEYVTVRLSSSATENVTISGWQLVSGATGKRLRIPQGTSLPRSGRVNDVGPITLTPGDEAIIVTGESPTGVSFKENMCTGYFAEHQRFYPQLSQYCPSPMTEFNEYYTGNKLGDDTCYQLMQRTSQCRTPDANTLRSTCYQLISNRLTYSGCVATHRYDPRFQLATWRIYLEHEDSDGDPVEFWKPSRDSVKLLDASGKTVDMVTY